MPREAARAGRYFRTPVIVCSTMLFIMSGVSMPLM